MNGSIVEENARRLVATICELSGRHAPPFVDYLSLWSDYREFYRKRWGIMLEESADELLPALREDGHRVMAAAFDAGSRGNFRGAAALMEVAGRIAPSPLGTVVRAGFLRRGGEVDQARDLCRPLLQDSHVAARAESELFMCDVAERFSPLEHYDFLEQIHTNRPPRVYLEIGVATGKSISLVREGTRAIGIDPATGRDDLLVFHPPGATPRLHLTTSDRFFETVDPLEEMGASGFDLAFVDGLHHFDQVLKDVCNLERLAGPDSVVLVHDTIPVDPRVATRERTTLFWTGDVWKIVPCLTILRPDLEIVNLPLAPSGLAVVRGLDPERAIPPRHLDRIVSEFESLELPKRWEDLTELLRVDRNLSSDFCRFVPAGGWR